MGVLSQADMEVEYSFTHYNIKKQQHETG